MGVLILLLLPLGGGAPAPDLPSLLRRAGAYVVAYGDAFRNVLAEEVYEQRLSDKLTRRAGGQTSIEPQHRTLRSDIVWIPLPGAIPWGSYRDTYEVDGQPLREHDRRLERILAGTETDRLQRAGALLFQSARYNLGTTFRNYTLPLVALLFLLPSNQTRFAFRARGEEHLLGVRAVRVDYEEVSRPTIIRDLDARGDLPTRGRFWVEAATGRVLRTLMRVSPEGGAGTLRVEFGPVEKLGLLAPLEMHDTYEDRVSFFEGQARYLNYRRFEAEAGPITYPR